MLRQEAKREPNAQPSVGSRCTALGERLTQPKPWRNARVRRGYDEPLIGFKNWLRVLGRTWGKAQNISRTNDRDANKSRESEGNELGPIIGSKQISDSPMSGLEEVSMAKKKTAKKKTKK
jgi:hypothetical protein